MFYTDTCIYTHTYIHFWSVYMYIGQHKYFSARKETTVQVFHFAKIYRKSRI